MTFLYCLMVYGIALFSVCYFAGVRELRRRGEQVIFAEMRPFLLRMAATIDESLSEEEAAQSLVVSLSVEGLPYDSLSPRTFALVRGFRKRRADERLRIARKAVALSRRRLRAKEEL